MKTAAELMELIPYETARRAHYWTSFVPEERGQQVQENFAATIINLFENCVYFFSTISKTLENGIQSMDYLSLIKKCNTNIGF